MPLISNVRRHQMAAPLVVGCLLWIPTLFIVSVVHGPWFNGLQGVAAVGPVLALLVPGLARIQSSGGAVAVWSIALAPLLAALGTITQFFVKRSMSGDVYSEYFESLSSVLVFFLCAVVGLLIYLALKPSNRYHANDA